MFTWKVIFTINGRRTEQLVKAYTGIDAKKIVEAQYSGQKVHVISYSKVHG